MARARIFLVEDEKLIALDTRRRLEKLGYEVVGVVATGAMAVTAIPVAAPDLVLMDIQLGEGEDGIATAEQVRAIHDVPIIYLTAYAEDETLERAKVTEPYGYLLKPSSDRELLVTIELALYRNRAERERERLQIEIKKLQGIIPICCSCKMVRKDVGYWQAVEDYVMEHSEAQFSHGICPECMAKLYPPDDFPHIYEPTPPPPVVPPGPWEGI